METIKTYINNLFSSLPNTPEVQKAKEELLSMMEDKYNELKQSGTSENEAVGVVISGFGNIDELKKELNLEEEKKERENPTNNAPQYDLFPLSQIKEYFTFMKKQTNKIAFAVMLCILSPVCLILLSGLAEFRGAESAENTVAAIGVLVLLVLVAIAVAIFITTGITNEKYKFIENGEFVINEEAITYLKKRREEGTGAFAAHLSIGVILCIFSVLPLLTTSVLLEDSKRTEFVYILMVGVLLLFVAIGVFVIITGSAERGCIKRLLKEEEYDKEHHKMDDKVGSIYWPLVTAIYLLWSFLTMDWHITWIVWPIAGVLYAALMGVYRLVSGQES